MDPLLPAALTVIIPARDHPRRVAQQLRLFKRYGIPGRTIIANSSTASGMEKVAAEFGADIRTFPRQMSLFAKLAEVVASVETPFILLSPDRKITSPRAVDLTLRHLAALPDHAAALGYVLGYADRGDLLDINRVVYFTPTIGEDIGLHRYYHLMRRYQSWLWSVFRRDALSNALAVARPLTGNVFQEVIFMNALALRGKLARLPVIFRMEGQEQSATPLKEFDPLFAFVADVRGFANRFGTYREALLRLMADLGLPAPSEGTTEQFVDVVNALWLHNAFDPGVLNYAAQFALGQQKAPPPAIQQWPAPRDLGPDDVLHAGKGRTHFLWRKEVVSAEPRDEITISADEMANIEAELDIYGTAE